MQWRKNIAQTELKDYDDDGKVGWFCVGTESFRMKITRLWNISCGDEN